MPDDLWSRLIQKPLFVPAANPAVTPVEEKYPVADVTLAKLRREYERLIVSHVPTMSMEQYARTREQLLLYMHPPHHVTEEMVEMLRTSVRPFAEAAGISQAEVDPDAEDEEYAALLAEIKRQQQEEGLL